MEEKTLLAEIKKEKTSKEELKNDAQKKTLEKIEKKYIELKGSSPKEEPKKQFETIKKSSEYTVNPFSASAFKNSQNVVVEKEQDNIEDVIFDEQESTLSASNSSVIETPNYDLIETLSDEQRQKIFKIEENREESASKPKPNRFKAIIFSILFAIFGIWGIVNIATLDNLSSSISDITTEYNMNLISYLNNLHNLDATNSENMENLFETIPKDQLPPNTIGEQSNWFDRFCNFIAGLFGG